jgi:hypothetical protein
MDFFIPTSLLGNTLFYPCTVSLTARILNLSGTGGIADRREHHLYEGDGARELPLRVIAELRSGRKRTHWMWFIFPQIAGLGYSETSIYYEIKSAKEEAPRSTRIRTSRI